MVEQSPKNQDSKASGMASHGVPASQDGKKRRPFTEDTPWLLHRANQEVEIKKKDDSETIH